METTLNENFSISPELRKQFEKQEQIRLELKRRICTESLYGTVKVLWSTIIDDPLVDNWHIKYLCDEMQIVGEWIINRKPAEYDLIVNVPPGTTKSTICSVFFHVWLWIRAPWIRIISSSHSSGISEDHASKARDVLNSELFISLFHHKIIWKSDKNRVNYYENLKNGSRCATSVDGNIMGKHGHLLLIDDLVDPKAVDSETKLPKANTYMGKTLSTRKVDKKNTPTVLIMQRLHQMDPTGYLLEKAREKGKRIKHICIPADDSLDNIQPPELKKHYKNGLMDPVRLDRETIDAMKIDMTEEEAAGQLNQSPVPKGGNILKKSWIMKNTYTELPKQRPIRTISSWDTAFKKGKLNAYNVKTTWLEYQHGHFLDDVFCEKMTYPELKAQVTAEAAKDNPDIVLVEDKSSGTPIIQELGEDSTINFEPILPTVDKTARAHAVSPTVKAGNVYIRGNAEWSSLVIEQLTMFPNCKIKDIMDSFSQYLNWVRDNPAYDEGDFQVDDSESITEGYY